MALGATAGAVLLGAVLCLSSGCSSLGYYAQSLQGHVQLLRAARPVADWQADPATPPQLAQRLALSQRMRQFAIDQLALPDNPSYRRYADLGRPAVVWNVVAAPELSLALKTWCFPVLGCVGYRGYFDRSQADALAVELRGQGLEAYVYGVPAYSTLGWSNWLGGDPLLNTFIGYSEGELARLIFHELAHQVAYADDDTTFNESFATAVERLGVAQWLQDHATPEVRAAQARHDARREDFRRLTQRTREALLAIYAGAGSDDDKRRAKQAALQRLREEHAALKAGPWAGFAGYDAWMAQANNASFGVLAAYNELVPQFERLYEREGRDPVRFHARVRELAAMPKDQRLRRLAEAADPAPPASR
jgi:predicted aminopeptidase